MRYMTLSAFLDAREETVANAQSALARALNHPDPGGRGVAFPAFGHGDRAAAVVDVGHPQHRDLRQTARLVQRAARTALEQAVIRHVLQPPPDRDLVRPVQGEPPPELPLTEQPTRKNVAQG